MLRGRENVRLAEEQPIRHRQPRRQEVGVAVEVEVQAEVHRGDLVDWAVRLPLVQGQVDRLHLVLPVPLCLAEWINVNCDLKARETCF